VKTRLHKETMIFLLILTSFVSGQLSNEKITQASQVRMGYSMLVFQDFNPQDANAAIFIWARALEKNLLAQHNVRGKLVSLIFNSMEEIETAMNKKEIDILAITTQEYFLLKEKFNLIPAFAGSINESIYTQYVLIVRNNSEINSLSDLKQKIIALLQEKSSPLMNIWLSNILFSNKKPRKNIYFGKIKIEEKESNAMYSVFFKKADCAIVQKSTYNTLCALNPQFKQSIKIIDTSPDLLLSLSVYRKEANGEWIKLFFEAAKTVNLTTEGQNILKIFKSNKTVEISENDLKSTKQLIDEFIKNNKNLKN
jgi:ABC-type phosphate/phosphonate transport system substrate-binding protein